MEEYLSEKVTDLTNKLSTSYQRIGQLESQNQLLKLKLKLTIQQLELTKHSDDNNQSLLNDSTSNISALQSPTSKSTFMPDPQTPETDKTHAMFTSTDPSTPQIKELSVALSNLKWGFKKREDQLKHQLTMYKNALKDVYQSHDGLRAKYKYLCENLFNQMNITEEHLNNRQELSQLIDHRESEIYALYQRLQQFEQSSESKIDGSMISKAKLGVVSVPSAQDIGKSMLDNEKPTQINANDPQILAELEAFVQAKQEKQPEQRAIDVIPPIESLEQTNNSQQISYYDENSLDLTEENDDKSHQQQIIPSNQSMDRSQQSFSNHDIESLADISQFFWPETNAQTKETLPKASPIAHQTSPMNSQKKPTLRPTSSVELPPEFLLKAQEYQIKSPKRLQALNNERNSANSTPLRPLSTPSTPSVPFVSPSPKKQSFNQSIQTKPSREQELDIILQSIYDHDTQFVHVFEAIQLTLGETLQEIHEQTITNQKKLHSSPLPNTRKPHLSPKIQLIHEHDETIHELYYQRIQELTQMNKHLTSDLKKLQQELTNLQQKQQQLLDSQPQQSIETLNTQVKQDISSEISVKAEKECQTNPQNTQETSTNTTTTTTNQPSQDFLLAINTANSNTTHTSSNNPRNMLNAEDLLPSSTSPIVQDELSKYLFSPKEQSNPTYSTPQTNSKKLSQGVSSVQISTCEKFVMHELSEMEKELDQVLQQPAQETNRYTSDTVSTPKQSHPSINQNLSHAYQQAYQELEEGETPFKQLSKEEQEAYYQQHEYELIHLQLQNKQLTEELEMQKTNGQQLLRELELYRNKIFTIVNPTSANGVHYPGSTPLQLPEISITSSLPSMRTTVQQSDMLAYYLAEQNISTSFIDQSTQSNQILYIIHQLVENHNEQLTQLEKYRYEILQYKQDSFSKQKEIIQLKHMIEKKEQSSLQMRHNLTQAQLIITATDEEHRMMNKQIHVLTKKIKSLLQENNELKQKHQMNSNFNQSNHNNSSLTSNISRLTNEIHSITSPTVASSMKSPWVKPPFSPPSSYAATVESLASPKRSRDMMLKQDSYNLNSSRSLPPPLPVTMNTFSSSEGQESQNLPNYYSTTTNKYANNTMNTNHSSLNSNLPPKSSSYSSKLIPPKRFSTGQSNNNTSYLNRGFDQLATDRDPLSELTLTQLRDMNL